MRALIQTILRRLHIRLAALRAAPTPPAPPIPRASLGKHPPAAPVADDPWGTADGHPSERLSPWE